MTANELMQPRFEVIAEYPICKFKKGEILLPIPRATNPWYHTDINCPIGEIQLPELENYPHLFRKLDWWEFRKIEDMPKKLISKARNSDSKPIEIKEWDINLLIGWVNKKERECCNLTAWKPEYGYFPID